MSEHDPGADLHIWETRYAALEEDLRTTPAEALPELLDLVEEMLVAAGYETTLPVTNEVPEVSLSLERARELVRRLDAGEEVPNDDAFEAAATLRSLYRVLIESPELDPGADLRLR